MFSEKLKEEENKNTISIDKVNNILDKALPDAKDDSVKDMLTALNLNRVLLRTIVIAYFEDIKPEDLNNKDRLEIFKYLYKLMIERSNIKEELREELLKKINNFSSETSQRDILGILELNLIDSELSKELDRILNEIILKNEKKSKIDTYISLMNS